MKYIKSSLRFALFFSVYQVNKFPKKEIPKEVEKTYPNFNGVPSWSRLIRLNIPSIWIYVTFKDNGSTLLNIFIFINTV